MMKKEKSKIAKQKIDCKHIRRTLIKMKKYALDLRTVHCIPFHLCMEIQRLNENTDFRIVEYLKNQCELMLRIKGFYKKYPEVEKQFNEQITNDLKKLNESAL